MSEFKRFSFTRINGLTSVLAPINDAISRIITQLNSSTVSNSTIATLAVNQSFVFNGATPVTFTVRHGLGKTFSGFVLCNTVPNGNINIFTRTINFTATDGTDPLNTVTMYATPTYIAGTPALLVRGTYSFLFW